MFNKLDHLIVAVKDLQEAENNYQKLFGMAPVWSGTHKELGTSNSLFNFQNTYFELLAPTSEGLGADLVNYYLDTTGEGLIGMVFATEEQMILLWDEIDKEIYRVSSAAQPVQPRQCCPFLY